MLVNLNQISCLKHELVSPFLSYTFTLVRMYHIQFVCVRVCVCVCVCVCVLINI
jgi:hypothetical protein